MSEFIDMTSWPPDGGQMTDPEQFERLAGRLIAAVPTLGA
jgi:hypothetical protein